ncbi:MAG: glycosyltransferase family 9 protein [Bacteroidia bacterium]|nr:glycosyltransferase family 9 protein [Bacteroidia bacterium]
MKKILIIRFSSIGDIILTTPVVRCIRKQTGAEVHFITKEQFSGILESNPYVDKVITIDKNVSEVADVLRGENYDFVVDLHHNLRSLQVKQICKAPSASFPKLNVKKWLLVNARIDLMPRQHIVDRYFIAAEKLGIKNDQEGLNYFIPENDRVELSNILPESHRKGYVAITAGAKFATKEMPLNRMKDLIFYLNRPVVVLGGKDDMAKGQALSDACGDLVFDACGKFNLNQTASLIEQSDAVIAHDTGMMHIAAAFRKKIFSVWGNTVPELGMYPYLPSDGSRMIQVKDLSCRPCSKIGYSECPKKHFRCMNDIPLEEFRELRA